MSDKDIKINVKSGSPIDGSWWIAYIIFIVLFLNFDDNEFDLYDLIYQWLLP